MRIPRRMCYNEPLKDRAGACADRPCRGGNTLGTSNFAVFVDLENVGGKESMLSYVIEKVKIRGDILLG